MWGVFFFSRRSTTVLLFLLQFIIFPQIYCTMVGRRLSVLFIYRQILWGCREESFVCYVCYTGFLLTMSRDEYLLTIVERDFFVVTVVV